MTATDLQVRIIVRERNKGKTQEQAAAKANLSSRKTVRKYERLGKLPSELRKAREYRTRSNPFEDDWAEAERMLEKAPELEAKTLFEWLCEQHTESVSGGTITHIPTPGEHLAGDQWERDSDTGAGSLSRRNDANGWYLDDRVGDHNQWGEVPPPADSQRAALFKLELGASGAIGVPAGNSIGSTKHPG